MSKKEKRKKKKGYFVGQQESTRFRISLNENVQKQWAMYHKNVENLQEHNAAGVCYFKSHPGLLTREDIINHHCCEKNCFALQKIKSHPYWEERQKKEEEESQLLEMQKETLKRIKEESTSKEEEDTQMKEFLKEQLGKEPTRTSNYLIALIDGDFEKASEYEKKIKMRRKKAKEKISETEIENFYLKNEVLNSNIVESIPKQKPKPNYLKNRSKRNSMQTLSQKKYRNKKQRVEEADYKKQIREYI